jgi:VanZ family protein
MKISTILNKPFLSVFITLIITVLCFMPSQNIPDNGPDDKTAHFLAFGALAFFWSQYFKNYIWVFLSLLFYAIFIELVQMNLPESFHRGYELLDIAADIIGVIIGFVFVFLYNKAQKKWPSVLS